jgi:uncharacterized protein RhaS with RHS repeats
VGQSVPYTSDQLAPAFQKQLYKEGCKRIFLQPDPIGLAGGINLYTYVGNNCINWVDPYGLVVQRCSGPSRPFPLVDHDWIKTDTKEAGMGPAGGGAEAGTSPVGDQTEITDHTGRSSESGSTCEDVPDVDENKVNELLEIGKSTGPWGPTNNCKSFVDDVLRQSRTKPPTPNPTLPSL